MQELVISILLTVVIIMAAVLLVFVGSRKGGMTKKQRAMMVRILITAIILLALQFVSAELFDKVDGYLFPSAGRWIRFACYLIDYFIIGYDILRKAAKGIKNRQVFDESFLMAVATIGAMALAIYENGEYLEAIAVMLFYQIGEWFLGYAVGKSRRNISNLMDIRPDYANVERNGALEQVDPDEVEIGSVIVVQSGEKVPIDGIIVEGASSLNTSALTGESLPREAKVGDEVISGCISMTGVLKIQTTKEFGESTVSKILDLVENASSRKSKSEDFISKFAKIYTPAVCYCALALAFLPPVVRMLFMGLSADWGVWIYRALTFLVISCPCALVISIPLSFFAGIGGASKEGVLVKGSNYLEILSQTKYVVFDKTGTMTKGVFEVNGIHHSAIENEKLIEYAIHVARHRETPGRVDFCPASSDEHDPVGAVHRCIHAAIHTLEFDAKEKGLPVRFAATKLVENDHLIAEQLCLTPEKETAFEHLVSVMEKETGLDREAALADMRFSFIESLCEKTVVRPHESREHKRSMAIDRILTGKYTAIPCFIGIMAFIFTMTFSFIGALLSDLMTMGVDAVVALLDKLLTAAEINPVVHSLVIDGICGGVGSVLSFLPTIVTLFFFLSILEDTGYMARVAFVMDRLLRKIGLSGRSIVPMLIGFGCSVPAIMSTRTLSSERDRKMTILLTPFMSCTAKLPIYSMMVSAFFARKYQALVMVGLYVLGIVCAILYALILKKTKYHGEPVPFVMELPNYRLPSSKSVLQLIFEKAKGFIRKAFTIIFVASIVIWFLQTFDIRLNIAASSEESLLAMLVYRKLIS